MSVVHVQTKREIEGSLNAAGLKPRRRFGQHFLIDGNLMRRLAASAGIRTDDTVLEVGGGTGGLTDLLLESAAHVICVEMDRGLYRLLEDRFREADNLTLLLGDILERKHRLRPEVAALIREAESHDARVLMVANLPYQVATPLIMHLIEQYPTVRRFCFTVQAEVGERFTALPGRKSFGPLAILSQVLCEIQTLAHLPAHVFWPVPQVDSIMLRMDVREPAPMSGDDLRRFARFIRKTFEHRRKTLRSALSLVAGYRIRDEAIAGLDLTRRPETLQIDEWRALFEAIVVAP